jgi:hypothetical protein
LSKGYRFLGIKAFIDDFQPYRMTERTSTSVIISFANAKGKVGLDIDYSRTFFSPFLSSFS